MSRDRAHAARDLLEAALLELPSLPPRVDRAPIARLVERAVDRLSRFEAEALADEDHGRAAAAAIAGAAAMLGAAAFGDETARRTIARLHAAKGHVEAAREQAFAEDASVLATRGRARGAASGRTGSADHHDQPGNALRASDGSPMIHRFASGPLAPAARLGGHGEDPAEGGAPRRLRPSYDPAAALHIEQLRGLARDAMEELGVLGGLRAAPRGVAWSKAFERYDQRLLRDLDALAALDAPVMFDGQPSLRLDVLREVIAWADDAFVVDPTRAFARAFVLACAEGEDALRAAVVALKQSDPRTWDAQKSALSLASSLGIARAMEDLARGEDPGLAALALDVLRLRRAARATLAAPLLAHPEALVRRSAARCLGAAIERETAATLIASAIEIETDESVVAAGAESLVRLGRGEGLAIARARLARGPIASGVRHELCRVLAVAGGPEDVGALIAPLAGVPTEDDVDAVARHGHAEGVTALLATLDRAERDLWALDIRQSIARAIRYAAGIAGDDARTLQAAWIEASARIDRAQKHRHGRGYEPIMSVDELSGEAPAPAREALAIEVAIASAGALRIEPTTWTARQLADLEAARALIAAQTWRPGEWPSARLAGTRSVARWT